MDAPTATATATAKPKRKRSAIDIRSADADANADTDAPAPGDASFAVDEVSDAEVEEFYAILRRMRDASRRLCAGTRAPARAPAWCPSFSREDFEPAPPTPAATPVAPRLLDKRVAENATPPHRQPGRLDLNAEPEPEPPAAAPTTPRPERATA